MKARFFNSDAGIERGNPDRVIVIESTYFQLTYSLLRMGDDNGVDDDAAWATKDEEWVVADAFGGGTFTDVVFSV